MPEIFEQFATWLLKFVIGYSCFVLIVHLVARRVRAKRRTRAAQTASS